MMENGQRKQRRPQTRPRRPDQAESSQQAMSTIHSTPAVLPLGKRSAFEGVARRQGRRRNPARTTPRSSLRTPTNPPRDHAQRGVEKCGRSITNSGTPHLAATTRPEAPTLARGDTATIPARRP